MGYRTLCLELDYVRDTFFSGSVRKYRFMLLRAN